jgi:putative ABC transport system ATP-binding protein
MAAHGFAAEAVTVRRGGTALLDSITVDIAAGACTAVVGPSGAGKSTLLRVFNRLEEPDTGQVCWQGTPLPDMDAPALRRRIGLVAQQPVLLAERVLDELRVGQPQLTGQAAEELLNRVGLPETFAERRSAELSGGQAQRVCLARALAVEPEVLLLDEPTTGLDAITASAVEDVIRGFVTAGGTVVVASHDAALVTRVAQQVVLLDGGRLVTIGLPTEIASWGMR